MMKKGLQKPPKLLKLGAVKRRLPLNYPFRSEIENEYAKIHAGYRGEKALDYYLGYIDKRNLIFHDLRIPDSEGRYFQMDTLIISLRFLIIIEAKNIKGTLFFDQSFNQLIRTLDGKEEHLGDPILQVKRQRLQLASWLKKHKFPSLPIIKMVSISNPSAIIKTEPHHNEVYETVFHTESLPFKVEKIESKHQKEYLSNKDMNRMSRLLLKQHTPLNTSILKQFNIPKHDILTGVHCPKCFKLPMKRMRGYWLCQGCGHKSQHAHIHTLGDYYLLIDNTITNQQFRHFTNLSSISIATKLLVGLNLEYSGNLKTRKYYLSSSFLEFDS
ncbi:NERD domain-containing protein [Aquibacillus sp. 3ASR75-11]|uniref:NERD domain-containing protein n=1 Tax=Terrihalobacillus insolitus TaxID=2950438 RepID=A0A9X3WNZ5_9BACI|nr:nuclease-related domain-containing protein [Terrihalobacillus insolitus]MDC3412137.1 NERD domain-containing protein [Terrihalobacillus insolitus]MDC3423170.1 NERD domain-containing protein [Terrihalobacillus insolitus]